MRVVRFEGERIELEGFALRPLRADDVGVVVAAGATDVPDWTFLPAGADEALAAAWIGRNLEQMESGAGIRFVIEVDGEAAGMVGGRYLDSVDRGIVETYYFVLPPFRRRGLASRALRAFDDWVAGAVPRLRRLQLHVIVGNPGSQAVAESVGYEHEGIAVARIGPVNGFGVRDAHVHAKRVGARPAAR